MFFLFRHIKLPFRSIDNCYATFLKWYWGIDIYFSSFFTMVANSLAKKL